MRYKGVMAIITGVMVSLNASADSFCGYDKGLIGTTAIGYVAPASLDTHRYETGACELNVFDTATDNSDSEVQLCTDFKHVPSANLDYYGTNEFDPIANEYFRLQAFDSKDLWVQLSLKTGEKKWTKLKYKKRYGFRYHFSAERIIESHEFSSYPTQSSAFLSPSLNAPDDIMGQYFRQITDFLIDQNIPLDFFNHEVFKILEKYEAFNPDHIEQGKLATYYGDMFELRYEVKSILKDEDGREWLETKEYLGLSSYKLFKRLEEKLAKLNTSLSEEEAELAYHNTGAIRSKAGRTVYFPYREPSGTITMVMTSGPDCD